MTFASEQPRCQTGAPSGPARAPLSRRDVAFRGAPLGSRGGSLASLLLFLRVNAVINFPRAVRICIPGLLAGCAPCCPWGQAQPWLDVTTKAHRRLRRHCGRSQSESAPAHGVAGRAAGGGLSVSRGPGARAPWSRAPAAAQRTVTCEPEGAAAAGAPAGVFAAAADPLRADGCSLPGSFREVEGHSVLRSASPARRTETAAKALQFPPHAAQTVPCCPPWRQRVGRPPAAGAMHTGTGQ